MVILPYNEPDRGGIEIEHSKIDFGVLGRLKKNRVVRFYDALTKREKKNEFRGVELVHLKLQGEKMLVCVAFP